MLKMFQSLSGQLVPEILTKGVSPEDLMNEEKRKSIATNLAEFIKSATDFEVDEHGYIIINLEP